MIEYLSQIESEIGLSVFEFCTEVRELCGYEIVDGIRMPTYGNRIALYHPHTSQIHAMNPGAWELYDRLKGGYSSGINEADRKLVADFKRNRIVNNNSEQVKPPDEGLWNWNNRMELYLSLTNGCNFTCSTPEGSCATGSDKHTAGLSKTLSKEDLSLILPNIVQSAVDKGIKEFHLKWAGGEALMPRVRELIWSGQELIASLRDKYPQIDITQVILTNGSYLNEQVVSALKKYQIRVSVSLWGIGEINNQMRGVHGKLGSYGQLVNNIGRLHNAGVRYNINHVVLPSSAEGFADFITALWDVDANSFIGKNWDWKGNPTPIPVGINFLRPQNMAQLAKMSSSGYQDIVSGLRGGFEVIKRLIESGVPVPPLSKIDYMRLFGQDKDGDILYDGVTPAPCGTGHNYVAIGPSGEIAPCHELLEQSHVDPSRAQVPTINLIDIANRRYQGYEQQLLGPNLSFGRKKDSVDYALGLHGGTGCPITAHMEHGELGHVASSVDRLYKPIFDEILSLETQRRLYRLAYGS
jgi:hypothetical protein